MFIYIKWQLHTGSHCYNTEEWNQPLPTSNSAIRTYEWTFCEEIFISLCFHILLCLYILVVLLFYVAGFIKPGQEVWYLAHVAELETEWDVEWSLSSCLQEVILHPSQFFLLKMEKRWAFSVVVILLLQYIYAFPFYDMHVETLLLDLKENTVDSPAVTRKIHYLFLLHLLSCPFWNISCFKKNFPFLGRLRCTFPPPPKKKKKIKTPVSFRFSRAPAQLHI